MRVQFKNLIVITMFPATISPAAAVAEPPVIHEEHWTAVKVADLDNPQGVAVGFDDDIFVSVGTATETTRIVRFDAQNWAASDAVVHPFGGLVTGMAFDDAEMFNEPRIIATDIITGCLASHPDFQRHFDANGNHIANIFNGVCSTSVTVKGSGPVWSSLILWGEAGSSSSVFRGRNAAGQTVFVAPVPFFVLRAADDVAVVVPPHSQFAVAERWTLVMTDGFIPPDVGLARVNDLGEFQLLGGAIHGSGPTSRGLAYDGETDTVLVRSGSQLLRVSADGEFSAVLDAPGLTGLALHPSGEVYFATSDALWALVPVNPLPVAVCDAYPAEGDFDSTNGGILVECDSPLGREVTLDGSGSFDPADLALTFHWDVSNLNAVLDDPDSALTSGMFPMGVTMATLTVTNEAGGVATCDVIIHVQDTTPPEVMVMSDLAMLWPPNHAMRAVQVIITASDVCEDPDFIFPLIVLLSSNEPDNAPGGGDGNTTGDSHGHDGHASAADITGEFTWDASYGESGAWIATIQLRAERSGSGSGRAYTFDVQALDGHLNVGASSCVVIVPKGVGGGNN